MTQALDSLQRPAFGVPPHVVDDHGLVAAWFTDPPGVVMQLQRPARGTALLAEWLTGPGFAQLTRRFPDARDLNVVLDMRQMTGRSATARAIMIEHGKAVASRLGTVTIIPSMHLGSAYIHVLEATALMLRAFGVRLELEQDLDRVLLRRGLRVGKAHELSAPLDASRAAVARRSSAEL